MDGFSEVLPPVRIQSGAMNSYNPALIAGGVLIALAIPSGIGALLGYIIGEGSKKSKYALIGALVVPMALLLIPKSK